MDEFKTSSELKQDAREMLKGRWKDAVLMNLLPALLGIATLALLVVGIATFSASTSDYFATESTYGDIEYEDRGAYSDLDVLYEDENSYNDTNDTRVTFVQNLFTTIITTGMSFAFLTAFRDPGYKIRPLRDAFQVFSKKYFLGVFLIYIVSSLFIVLWTLLFFIPGLIKSYSYSQAYLIYKDHADHPNTEKVSAINCITESRELMDGHKGRLFALDLSFIGWYLIGFLTLGIGFLWITPFTTAARTAFYNDLVGGTPTETDMEWDEDWEDEEWNDSLI